MQVSVQVINGHLSLFWRPGPIDLQDSLIIQSAEHVTCRRDHREFEELNEMNEEDCEMKFCKFCNRNEVTITLK